MTTPSISHPDRDEKVQIITLIYLKSSSAALSDNHAQVQQAYQHLQNLENQKARNILQPLLSSLKDPSNPQQLILRASCKLGLVCAQAAGQEIAKAAYEDLNASFAELGSSSMMDQEKAILYRELHRLYRVLNVHFEGADATLTEKIIACDRKAFLIQQQPRVVTNPTIDPPSDKSPSSKIPSIFKAVLPLLALAALGLGFLFYKRFVVKK